MKHATTMQTAFAAAGLAPADERLDALIRTLIEATPTDRGAIKSGVADALRADAEITAAGSR